MNEKCVWVPGHLRVHLIPKVASASIYKAFHVERRAALVPATAVGGEYRWAVVRHPLDRLVSLHTYFCVGDGLKGQPQVAKLGYSKGQCFADFVDVICERHWENIHTRKQAEFNIASADCLVRYENLAEGWAALTRKFPDVKMMKTLPIIHQTKHPDWRSYYDADLRQRAEEAFAEDVKIYQGAKEPVDA